MTNGSVGLRKTQRMCAGKYENIIVVQLKQLQNNIKIATDLGPSLLSVNFTKLLCRLALDGQNRPTTPNAMAVCLQHLWPRFNRTCMRTALGMVQSGKTMVQGPIQALFALDLDEESIRRGLEKLADDLQEQCNQSKDLVLSQILQFLKDLNVEEIIGPCLQVLVFFQ